MLAPRVWHRARVPTLPIRRPSLDVPVFAQRDGTVRLGWHPEATFVVTPPDGVAQSVLLDLLVRIDGVHSRAHLIWYAGTVGLSANSMSTLLGELAEHGVLSERATGDHTDRTAQETGGSHGNGSEATPKVVHVVGRGPIADAVVTGLLPSPLLTVRRSTPSPTALLAPPADDDVDLAVLTDDMVPDPRVVTSLVRTRTPHLQVRLRDGRGIVGPFVVPGRSSCLRCADLTRSGLDPRWPHIAAQLLGRVGDASRPTILATAAIALGQIEDFLGETVTPLLDTTMEVDLLRHAMTTRRWARHPWCDCWI